jgi:hypothetical protein
VNNANIGKDVIGILKRERVSREAIEQKNVVGPEVIETTSRGKETNLVWVDCASHASTCKW